MRCLFRRNSTRVNQTVGTASRCRWMHARSSGCGVVMLCAIFGPCRTRAGGRLVGRESMQGWGGGWGRWLGAWTLTASKYGTSLPAQNSIVSAVFLPTEDSASGIRPCLHMRLHGTSDGEGRKGEGGVNGPTSRHFYRWR